VLNKENTVLVVVDVQTKLLNVMHEKDDLLANLKKLVHGVQVLEVPIIWNEQYPQGLGSTVPELAELMGEETALPKVCFSCYQNPEFVTKLEALGRKQVLLCGIEAHICVYQTALELQANGYEVEVVTDAISSRALSNKEIAITKLDRKGIGLTSTEMALFELLAVAKGDQFKAINRIVK